MASARGESAPILQGGQQHLEALVGDPILREVQLLRQDDVASAAGEQKAHGRGPFAHKGVQARSGQFPTQSLACPFLEHHGRKLN